MLKRWTTHLAYSRWITTGWKKPFEARSGDRVRPNSLYDIVADFEEAPAEARFVDAVNLNLRRGRALILVVGDGIRTETQRLVDLFQSHGTAHFTFALVELAIFSLPDSGRYLVSPRTLAKTEIINRSVIQVDDVRTKIRLQKPPSESASPSVARIRAPSITVEQFFENLTRIDRESPEKVQELRDALEKLGVFEEFTTRLIFKWESPLDKVFNLGAIRPDGRVPTRAVNWFAPTDLSHQYIEELARAWGMDVNRNHERDWFVAGPDGKTVKLSAISDKLDRWAPIVARFQERIRERAEELQRA
ncbi:MAG: hypothetical protein U1E67_21220 [Hyphomicrobiales bacterium]